MVFGFTQWFGSGKWAEVTKKKQNTLRISHVIFIIMQIFLLALFIIFFPTETATEFRTELIFYPDYDYNLWKDIFTVSFFLPLIFHALVGILC